MSVSLFQLYRLPSVPLKDVFKLMGPIALLALSMTSKKSTLIVTRLAKKLKPIHLQVNAFLDTYSYGVTFRQNFESGALKIVNERGKQNYHPLSYWTSNDGYVIPLKFQSLAICIFEHDKAKGIAKAIEMLTNILQVKSISLYVSKTDLLEQDETFVKSILTCFKQHKLKIETINVNITFSNDDFYEFIIDESMQASELKIFGNRYNVHFKLNSLKIDYSHWVTLNNLYSFMNCTSLQLYRIRISEQELNLFIKQWMLEESKMEYMHLSMNVYIDIPTIIQGLNAEAVNEIPKDVIDSTLKHRLFGPIQCYKIQRADGVRANIWGADDQFFLKIIQ